MLGVVAKRNAKGECERISGSQSTSMAPTESPISCDKIVRLCSFILGMFVLLNERFVVALACCPIARTKM